MKKSLVLLASILFGVSAYASIPIIDASSVIETQSLSSGLLETIAASMEDETLIAALLCFFLGTLGVHWFYLGNTAKGLARLGLFLGGYAVVVAGALAASPALVIIGYLALLANFVLVIADLIKILTNKV
jgi:TM2 domain-containing membrane protein YozV|tara:strand:- start:139 stop:528 length:390 start_codon:yes stop_codon:yes gene_type:complete